MATNSFAADISKWVEKTGVKGEVVLKKIAFDGFAGVILRSPVDTGRFRGSWRVSVNQVDPSVEPDRNGAPSPLKGQGGSAPHSATEIAVLSTAIQHIKWGDKIYITNNLPYGPALEAGYSQQAPAGILVLTFLELQFNLEALVNSVP